MVILLIFILFSYIISLIHAPLKKRKRNSIKTRPSVWVSIKVLIFNYFNLIDLVICKLLRPCKDLRFVSLQVARRWTLLSITLYACIWVFLYSWLKILVLDNFVVRWSCLVAVVDMFSGLLLTCFGIRWNVSLAYEMLGIL